MALFPRRCPERSNKIAEGLILQQGLGKVVTSPVTGASQPFGLIATAPGPGRRGPSRPRPWQQAGLGCLLQAPEALRQKIRAQNWSFEQLAAIPPPPSRAKRNFNVLPTSLFSTHKEKRKKLIIIYKRSSFQTNGEAFNADTYFPPLFNGIYLNADFLVSYVEPGRNAFQFKC